MGVVCSGMTASEGGGAGGWGAVTEGESGSGFTSGIARSDEAGIVQDYTFTCAAAKKVTE